MDIIELLSLAVIILPLVLAVCFIITFLIYKRSSTDKIARLTNAVVLGIIAWILVFLPFILVVSAIIGGAIALLPVVAIPIALAVAFAIVLKRYIKNSNADEIKRKRGITAIILGSSSWVMIYALDCFLAFLFLGVISAM